MYINPAFNDPNLVALMREQAIKLKELYNAPLRIRFNGHDIVATYRGCLFGFRAYKTYATNKSRIKDWQKGVDIKIKQEIEQFANPIYREVFNVI